MGFFEELDKETRAFDKGLRDGAKRYDKELFNDYTREELESSPEDESNKCEDECTDEDEEEDEENEDADDNAN